MKFTVEVKALGRINEAKINFSPLTVIAGCNNSGKSFISKSLYTFINAMNQDHVGGSLENAINSADYSLAKCIENVKRIGKKDEIFFESSRQYLNSIQNEFSKWKIEVDFLNSAPLSLIQASENLENSILDYQLTHGDRLYNKYDSEFDLFRKASLDIKNSIRNPIEVISKGLSQAFATGLMYNFQISSLSSLKNKKSSEDSVSFHLEGIGPITIKGDSVKFSLNQNGIKELQKFSRVIYLESPIYWKLAQPLQGVTQNAFWLFRKGKNIHLTGVPQYFLDLMGLLKIRGVGENQFKDILSKIKSVLEGEIRINDSGDLEYLDKDGQSHSLHLTALGVSNLGMLGLLLERQLIDPGTFLFIDEPEAHLHPCWQVILLEVLYELSKRGVNVVITTHSIDMVKYLEVLHAENSDFDDMVSINHLDTDDLGGVTCCSQGKSNEDTINDIIESLSSPYLSLFARGNKSHFTKFSKDQA